MNLQKTGMYLAQKRKELGLTQKQLAEKLGMSDKSVSKWERGICLPDVSVYIELCNILGITINEFLAGEDIQIEEIEKKSESNLLYIIKDSKQIQKNFKKIIYLLSISLFAMIVIVGTAIYKQNAAKNYMEPLSKDSLEVKTAELL